MPVIDHKSFSAQCADGGSGWADVPVFLIHGDEFLVKSAFETLVRILVGDAEMDLSYEPVFDGEGSLAAALEKMNTFSLLGGTKVVGLLDSRIFYSKSDLGALLDKAKDAFDRDDIRKASSLFLKLLALAQMSLEDIIEGGHDDLMKLTGGGSESTGWIDHIVDHCRSAGLSVPLQADDQALLDQAISKGFPPGHHFIITTDMVDRRRRLYQTIQKAGAVVDCRVPTGERRADKNAQTAVIDEQLNGLLAAHGCSLEPAARRLLQELIGFDLRALVASTRKLIHYAGDRKTIGLDDVRAVVKRVKAEPLFELTNAFGDRNAPKTLACLEGLLTDGFHPLQILAALVNQMRKILIAKQFTSSDAGRHWQPGCPYDAFRSRVMPAIEQHDAHVGQLRKEWADRYGAAAAGGSTQKGKPSDLLVAPNPRNPYPVYQLLKKTDRFTLPECRQGLRLLGEADRLLKSTGADARLVLESTILDVCGTKRLASHPGEGSRNPGAAGRPNRGPARL